MAEEVTETARLKEIFETKSVVVVDFFAHWCGPCKKSSPVFAKVAQKYVDSSASGNAADSNDAKGKDGKSTKEAKEKSSGDIAFIKIDIDKFRVDDVKAVPTFRVYKNRSLKDEMVGAPTPKMLEQWIEKNVGVPSKQSKL